MSDVHPDAVGWWCGRCFLVSFSDPHGDLAPECETGCFLAGKKPFLFPVQTHNRVLVYAADANEARQMGRAGQYANLHCPSFVDWNAEPQAGSRRPLPGETDEAAK